MPSGEQHLQPVGGKGKLFQIQNFAERLSDVMGSDNVSFSLIGGAAHMDPAFYTDKNLTAVFNFLQGTSTSSCSNS